MFANGLATHQEVVYLPRDKAASSFFYLNPVFPKNPVLLFSFLERKGLSAINRRLPPFAAPSLQQAWQAAISPLGCPLA
jgi:hypothetical protein